MASDAQRSRGLRVAALLLLGAGVIAAQTNLDFHEGQIGDAPPRWNVYRANGQKAHLTGECPRPGTRCAVLEYQGEGEPAGFGSLMQPFAPGPLRNCKVGLKASVSVEKIADCGRRYGSAPISPATRWASSTTGTRGPLRRRSGTATRSLERWRATR